MALRIDNLQDSGRTDDNVEGDKKKSPREPRTPMFQVEASFSNVHSEVQVTRASSVGTEMGRHGSVDTELGVTDAKSTGSTLTAPTPSSMGKRKSVVGAEVQNAWMTRGWTLQAHISKSDDKDLKDLRLDPELDGDAVCRVLQDKVHDRQRTLTMVTEVNKQLQSALVTKKSKEQELRGKIDVLIEKLTAACGVEKRARETSEAALEERILTEEREKQDMQLSLSQDIRMREESIAKVRAANDNLVEANSQNKKLMKDQQAQIKERQKAIRHLQRQIQVLESSRKTAVTNVGDQMTPEQGFGSNRFSTAEDVDGDGMLMNQREKSLATGDSKGLLRGARAEKHLEEEKKRIQAQKLETKDLTTKNAARTMADMKTLPGLDLNKLLGISQPVSFEKS